jgi:hypothetical protein
MDLIDDLADSCCSPSLSKPQTMSVPGNLTGAWLRNSVMPDQWPGTNVAPTCFYGIDRGPLLLSKSSHSVDAGLKWPSNFSSKLMLENLGPEYKVDVFGETIPSANST